MSRRQRRPPLKACRQCKALVPRDAKECPVCGSRNFTDDWEGALIVLDPEKSRIARSAGVEKPGRYAVKVR
jgi:DNA-directed RNA polymerase subunit E"